MGHLDINTFGNAKNGGIDVDLGPVTAAVNTALASTGDRNLSELLLNAANAMPATASDFDRGIAVGLAMAQLFPQIAQDDRLETIVANTG